MSPGLPPLRSVGFVFVGGAIGAVVRVAFATWFPTQPGVFPWTTFSENALGAFLLAGVLTVLATRARVSAPLQLLVGTGALGAFTTYSTFAVELERLLDGGALAMAAVYAGGTLLAGLSAASAGIAAGRAVGRPSPGRDGRERT